jgi:hypothetical protein
MSQGRSPVCTYHPTPPCDFHCGSIRQTPWRQMIKLIHLRICPDVISGFIGLIVDTCVVCSKPAYPQGRQSGCSIDHDRRQVRASCNFKAALPTAVLSIFLASPQLHGILPFPSTSTNITTDRIRGLGMKCGLPGVRATLASRYQSFNEDP